MAKKIYNYCAFYVKEPFNESNLGANTAHDFVYYNTLRMWKGNDRSFPFLDAHGTTYQVRDSSLWETLRTKLHERLDNSKNIIFFLSSITKESRALKEELFYGMAILKLPVIVVYPDYSSNLFVANGNGQADRIKRLWDNVPTFKNNMTKVPTVHVPMNKDYIQKALEDSDFTLNGKSFNFCWCYN
ncbi:MAG: hypothetical protein LKE41_01120 [Prevotella sp.]|jgi:hypothetical protein|nr:hypothetical protein [Prevotella sp.]